MLGSFLKSRKLKKARSRAARRQPHLEKNTTQQQITKQPKHHIVIKTPNIPPKQRRFIVNSPHTNRQMACQKPHSTVGPLISIPQKQPTTPVMHKSVPKKSSKPHLSDVMAQSFAMYSQMNVDEYPRAMFLSLCYLSSQWDMIPFSVIYSSIFCFNAKREWILPRNELEKLRAEQQSPYRRKEWNPLFLQLLQSKNDQKMIIWLRDYDSDTEMLTKLRSNVKNSEESFDFPPNLTMNSSHASLSGSMTPDSIAFSPLSIGSPMAVSRHTLPRLTPTSPNISNDSSTLGLTPISSDSLTLSAYNSGFTINPIWQYCSHRLSQIIDPIASDSDTVNALYKELDWSVLAHILSDDYLVYVEDTKQITNELRSGVFQFKPAMEIIHHCAPSIIPMVGFDIDIYRKMTQLVSHSDYKAVMKPMKSLSIIENDLSMSGGHHFTPELRNNGGSNKMSDRVLPIAQNLSVKRKQSISYQQTQYQSQLLAMRKKYCAAQRTINRCNRLVNTKVSSAHQCTDDDYTSDENDGFVYLA